MLVYRYQMPRAWTEYLNERAFKERQRECEREKERVKAHSNINYVVLSNKHIKMG